MAQSSTLSLHPQPAWPRRLAPRTSDWVSGCLYVGVLLDYLVLHTGRLLHWESALLLLCFGLLIAGERWEYRRFGERTPPKVGALLLVLSVALIEASVRITAEGMGPFLYVIIPLRAWLIFGHRAGYAISLAITAIYTAQTIGEARLLGLPLAAGLSSAILFATAIAFVLTISYLAREDRSGRERAEGLAAELERSNRELAAYAASAADSAAIAERSRVARDIHDSLGHYLTALNIQLEKALAFQERDAAETQRTLQTARRLAHEALADVRRSVGLLRAGSAPFSLAAMLRELAHGERPAVTVSVAGDEGGFPVEARLALYRVAQEGLTNIRRHAEADRAALTLQFAPGHALLQIRDDGRGFALGDGAGDDRHFGIQGMRERVALLGGELVITSAPGQGTSISVRVPQAPGPQGPEGVRR